MAYQKTGFANWIEFDPDTQTIKYGDWTFNPSIFGVKVKDKGPWQPPKNVNALTGVAEKLYGMNTSASSQGLGVGDALAKGDWEKSRVSTSWKDSKGNVYNETGPAGTLLPMSQEFAQSISDMAWSQYNNGADMRHGKTANDKTESPMKGNAPKQGLLV
jgi:hypothetical protein